MYYAAIIAAQCEDLPWVGISSSLNPVTPISWTCPLSETIAALADERDSLFARYDQHLSFSICDALSPWHTFVFSTEAYAPIEIECSAPITLVGPSAPLGPRGDEEAFPWEELDTERPLVYMSLGSQNYSHPDLFTCVANSLARMGVQTVMALHDMVDTDFAANLPASVIKTRYAPQLALLDRAALVVSHGGANTVMESLLRGLPLLLLPLLNDQPLQARFLERSGAGIALDPSSLDEEICQRSLAQLLAPKNSYQRSAEGIGRSYQGRDGASLCASHIVNLANEARGA